MQSLPPRGYLRQILIDEGAKETTGATHGSLVEVGKSALLVGCTLVVGQNEDSPLNGTACS